MQLTDPNQPDRLERLIVLGEQQHQSIEELIAGMGLLLEGQTEFRSDLAEIRAITKEQAEVAQRQSQTVDRLVQIVERLLEANHASN